MGDKMREVAAAEETPLIYERGGEATNERSEEVLSSGGVESKPSVNGGPSKPKHPLTTSVGERNVFLNIYIPLYIAILYTTAY